MRERLVICFVLLVGACGHESASSGTDADVSDGGTPGGASDGATPACKVAPASEPMTVATTRGLVRGVAANATTAFLGLPYAAPPVGALRLAPPVDYACWDGVRDTTSYGSDCLQRDVVSGDVRGAEDCLVLNVWTPDLRAQASLPVMFWIHGGANVIGSANQHLSSLAPNLYDGEALATREHAVVVSINYRLGALGFLAHPDLGQHSAQHASGNYGILDQIAALTWVRDNIAGFGGDPARVMVFGESAGAMDTCVLLASPLAEGLFSRALMESGDCSAQPRAKAEAAGAAFAAKLGCGDAACLRQLPAASLVPAALSLGALGPSIDLRHGLANTLDWAASIDGWAVPADPMATLLAAQQAKVPLVVGTNADEMALFLVGSQSFTCAQYESDMNALFGADAAKVIAGYPCVLDGRASEVAALTDLSMTCPAQRIARALEDAAVPAYRYYFDHAATYGPTVLLGAYHTAELAYVFGSFAGESYLPTPAEQQLSDTMQDHWGRHAATGAPNGSGLTPWPVYSTADPRWLELAATASVEADRKIAVCDLWAQILGW